MAFRRFVALGIQEIPRTLFRRFLRKTRSSFPIPVYFFRRKEGGGPARPRIPVKSNKEKSTIIQHNSIYI